MSLENGALTQMTLPSLLNTFLDCAFCFRVDLPGFKDRQHAETGTRNLQSLTCPEFQCICPDFESQVLFTVGILARQLQLPVPVFYSPYRQSKP